MLARLGSDLVPEAYKGPALLSRRNDGVGAVRPKDIVFGSATDLRLCPYGIPWVDEPPFLATRDSEDFVFYQIQT